MGTPDFSQGDPNAAETVSAQGKSRRRRRSHAGSRRSRGRLRRFYFALAAIWGFLIGTAAILGGLAALGRPLHLGTLVGGVLLAGAMLALVGGLIAAAAYGEASNRFR